MPVLSRTRLAAACAVLSTAVMAGMAAVTVLAGDRSCDLRGCPQLATFTVTAVRAAEAGPTCPALPTTPGAATTRDPLTCDGGGGGGDRVGTGGMATARVPAP